MPLLRLSLPPHRLLLVGRRWLESLPPTPRHYHVCVRASAAEVAVEGRKQEMVIRFRLPYTTCNLHRPASSSFLAVQQPEFGDENFSIHDVRVEKACFLLQSPKQQHLCHCSDKYSAAKHASPPHSCNSSGTEISGSAHMLNNEWKHTLIEISRIQAENGGSDVTNLNSATPCETIV
ncbi:hypothetical protein ABZP36_000598 [Zizania latifolia]